MSRRRTLCSPLESPLPNRHRPLSAIAADFSASHRRQPAAGTAPPGSATPATAAACDRAPWQPVVQGAPAGFDAGDRGGDYLWHDLTGFHLRVTHRNDGRQVYSGLITSSAPMRIDPVRLERGDVLRLSPDHRSLVFAFADYGRIDGVNFHTDCAAALAVSRLHVGKCRRCRRTGCTSGRREAHPAAVPFVLHRI